MKGSAALRDSLAPVEARVLEALRLWSRDEFRAARGLYADEVADLLERAVWVSTKFVITIT